MGAATVQTIVDTRYDMEGRALAIHRSGLCRSVYLFDTDFLRLAIWRAHRIAFQSQ